MLDRVLWAMDAGNVVPTAATALVGFVAATRPGYLKRAMCVAVPSVGLVALLAPGRAGLTGVGL